MIVQYSCGTRDSARAPTLTAFSGGKQRENDGLLVGLFWESEKYYYLANRYNRCTLLSPSLWAITSSSLDILAKPKLAPGQLHATINLIQAPELLGVRKQRARSDRQLKKKSSVTIPDFNFKLDSYRTRTKQALNARRPNST